jgi:pimeloyl-ACP methyl ester carboxylesterase
MPPSDVHVNLQATFSLSTMRLSFLSVLAAYGILSSQSHAQGRPDPLVAALGPDFTSDTARVNGTTLHYVRGGHGPAIVLIHGFPEDWFAYHAIMPRLAKRFTVIAVDLRGIGGSKPTPGGYDAATVAADIARLMTARQLHGVYIVGHDLGGIVAYALVRSDPQAVRGAMILDAPIPGIAGWDESMAGVWHVGFMQVPGLAEKLLAGREADYFGYFFNFGRFTPVERAHFVQAYSTPSQLHAVLEMYRAFPVDAQFNAAHQGPIDVPLFLAGGDKSSFVAVIPQIVAGLRASGFTHVTAGVIPGAVHYDVQDQPDAVASLIEHYASPTSSSRPGAANQ